MALEVMKLFTLFKVRNVKWFPSCQRSNYFITHSLAKFTSFTPDPVTSDAPKKVNWGFTMEQMRSKPIVPAGDVKR